MSPYLFIICTEVLSRLLFRASSAGNLRGIKCSKNGLELSHVLFADDLVLFGRATKKYLEPCSLF